MSTSKVDTWRAVKIWTKNLIDIPNGLFPRGSSIDWRLHLKKRRLLVRISPPPSCVDMSKKKMPNGFLPLIHKGVNPDRV